MKENLRGNVLETVKSLFSWIRGARVELARVYWPTRKETFQTVAFVMLMVAVMGLILWVFDLLLVKWVAWITGYGVVS